MEKDGEGQTSQATAGDKHSGLAQEFQLLRGEGETEFGSGLGDGRFRRRSIGRIGLITVCFGCRGHDVEAVVVVG